MSVSLCGSRKLQRMAAKSPTQQLISRREEKQSNTKELCRAAGSGDLAKVKALLAQGGVLIDDTDAHGSSAAHYAARHGRLDVVAYLHGAGARFDRKNVRLVRDRISGRVSGGVW